MPQERKIVKNILESRIFRSIFGTMKYLVFIRGEDSPLKRLVVSRIMAGLNPDINTTRGMRVSMDNYGPIRDKGERKAASRSAKNMTKKLLGTYQEQFIVIDNPNLRMQDWVSYFSLAESIRINVLGIGIDVCENEQDNVDAQKNEQDPNSTLFQASMYKYTSIKNEQDIDPAIALILSSERGE